MKGAIMLSGGGSGKLFAAIGVTYPAGSTLTCTNGTKTLTAKTTSGQWVFAIPDAGTWTVTATDGTNTKSQSVSITKEGQWESVALSYQLYLFKEGVGVANGYTIKPVGTSSSVTNEYITATSYHGENWYFEPKLDISNYSKLHIEASMIEKAQGNQNLKIGVADNHLTSAYSDLADWNAVATLPFNDDGNRYTATADLSQISGSKYVQIYSNGVRPEIYNFWLE